MSASPPVPRRSARFRSRQASSPERGNRVPSSGLTRCRGKAGGSSVHGKGLVRLRRRSKTETIDGDDGRTLLPPSATGADRTCTSGTYRPTLGVRRKSDTASHLQIRSAYILSRRFQTYKNLHILKIENDFLDFAADGANVVFHAAIQGGLQVGQHCAEFFGIFGVGSRQQALGLCN
jgi:hypothetical protein